ncbi:MAG: anti-sigma factor family protein [Polyangiales bacterium]
MTPTEARELFSAALDGELDDARARELRACLAADPELQREYAAFEATLALVRKPAGKQAPAPDLLAGVQERLRNRSRGRFYNDRFAQRRGRGLALPLLLGVVMLGLLALAWLGLSLIEHATIAR